jgi:hypothetical protein
VKDELWHVVNGTAGWIVYLVVAIAAYINDRSDSSHSPVHVDNKLLMEIF